MLDLAWRLGATLAALVILAFVGSNVGSNPDTHLVDGAWGRTPEMQITSYLAAVAGGNRPEALARWAPADASNAPLQARRASITDELLAYGAQLEYRVLDVAWWRTCCEPGTVGDPDEAGGARVRVAVGGGGRPEWIFLFDLLVPGTSGGQTADQPDRQWIIVDVYPEGEAPLAWALEQRTR
jgi:hypothetical protein